MSHDSSWRRDPHSHTHKHSKILQLTPPLYRNPIPAGHFRWPLCPWAAQPFRAVESNPAVMVSCRVSARAGRRVVLMVPRCMATCCQAFWHAVGRRLQWAVVPAATGQGHVAVSATATQHGLTLVQPCPHFLVHCPGKSQPMGNALGRVDREEPLPPTPHTHPSSLLPITNGLSAYLSMQVPVDASRLRPPLTDEGVLA